MVENEDSERCAEDHPKPPLLLCAFGSILTTADTNSVCAYAVPKLYPRANDAALRIVYQTKCDGGGEEVSRAEIELGMAFASNEMEEWRGGDLSLQLGRVLNFVVCRTQLRSAVPPAPHEKAIKFLLSEHPMRPT